MRGRCHPGHWISVVSAALFLLGGGEVAPAAAAGKDHVDLVLVLAVDISESIDDEEARLQRVGYAEAFTDRRVLAAIEGGRHGSIAVAYVEWAGPGEQRTVVGWKRITGPESARTLRDALARHPVGRGYWTSISGAIAYATALIEDAPFRGTRRVIDLSSDGRNNAGAPLTDARARALARGITINGLPVVARRHNFRRPPMPYLDRYFEQCVIGGPGAFIEVAEGFADFTRAVRRKLVREIAGLPAVRAAAAAQPAPGPRLDCGGPPPRAEAAPTAAQG